jgi:hypothetical protein
MGKRWGDYKDHRNWSEYNERLVKRGELYIALDFLESWDTALRKMNKGKRGRPYRFPEPFIQFMAFIHVLFLPYREMEGFLRKLSQYIPAVKVADYTTLWWRVRRLEIDVKQPDHDDMVIAVDSTGVKVTNRGEWLREKWKVHRGWIKVHIAVDTETNRLVGLEVTDESVGDSEEFEPLVEQAGGSKGKVKKALGDGAYDSKPNFNYLEKNGIESGIKTRIDASTLSRGSPYRAKCVRERKRLGYKSWRDRYGYGMRWKTESFNSGVKRIFGEYVRATSVAGALQEAAMKFMFYSMLISA